MKGRWWSSGGLNLVVIVAGVNGAAVAREAALHARPRPSFTAELIPDCDVPVSVDTGGRR